MKTLVRSISEMILATGTEVRVRKSILLPTHLQQITQEMDWV